MDEKDKKEVEDLMNEIRSTKDSLDKERADLEERKAQLDEQQRALEARHIENPKGENKMEWRTIADQMIESVENKRAITIDGTGTERVNFVNELQKKMVAKRPLLAEARYFVGPNASTEIPLLKAGIATPAKYKEGISNYPQAADEQAELGSKAVKPVAYVSLLPVTAEALQFGYIDVEAELPDMFAEAFADAMQLGMVKGAGGGTEMKGLFDKTAVDPTNQIACEADGLPTMKDLVGLALKLNDITDGAVMIMNPNTYANITATATDDYKIYKEELIRNKTVEGVKVILTSYAPNTTAEGDLMVWGGHLSNYGIGQAATLTIEPQKKVGDPSTYFLATAWFNGDVIREDNAYALKAVAPAVHSAKA